MAEKTGAALRAGLSVIACIGESLEEREMGGGEGWKVVVERQMGGLAKGIEDWR